MDDDLGRSAAGGVTRAGFDRMVVEVCLGKVGAVAAREVSRFARNSRDWQQLIEMCRVVDTVLIDQEAVYAPRQGNDRLLPIEHPRRHLQRSVRGSAGKAATENCRPFGQRLMDMDKLTEPGMPRIQKFANLCPVGVLSSRCTTSSGHTARSATRCRHHS